MKLALDSRNTITGYYCQTHNAYNDILSLSCKYCNSCKLTEELTEYSYYIKLVRKGEFIDMTSTDMIELHSRFFNHEKVMIKDMDDAAMHVRREELRKIAYEAKARLNAIDEEDRVRSANRSRKSKEWLLNSGSNDPSVTDAITAVKARKERMSKADKMLATLQSLGVANADSLVIAAMKNSAVTSVPVSERSPVKVREKEQTCSALCLSERHHNCEGKFIFGGESETRICDCKCHKPKVKFNLETLKLKNRT